MDNDGVSSMNITPEFSTQEEVYELIINYLDEAIVALDEPSAIDLNEEGGDVLYGGDHEKWKKFAYAIKARYLNHLAKKSSYDPDAVIEACQLAINSNELNAQKIYGGGTVSNDIQPFSSEGYGSSRVDYFSDFFVSLLKNPLNIENAEWDPRLTIIVPEAVNGGYEGVVIGRGLKTDDLTTPDIDESETGDEYSLGNGGFYTSTDSATDMITFSEVKFIEAEALVRTNGSDADALKAMKDAVEANMLYIGVDSADVKTYVDALTLTGSSANKIETILNEKYKALYGNAPIEVWVDYRRTGYPDLLPSPDAQSSLNPSKIIPRRFLYPISERNTNKANYDAAISAQGGHLLDVDMWAFPKN